jgi:DNA (cytosine-5)-methyltransferase 1
MQSSKGGFHELALFAGAGGGILGGHLLGWKTVCAVEWADYPRRVLLARQRDGILPRFPIWDDVQTFDGRPWHRRVDIVSGGFPCQDISAAGKGAGIEGERSGIWKHMARVVHEVRPRFVFVENSPMLTSRGLGTVLADLAEMGYDARWCVLGADDAGANHHRKRIWILAYTNSKHGTTGSNRSVLLQDDGTKRSGQGQEKWGKDWKLFEVGQKNDSILTRKRPEPEDMRVDDVMADRLDRLKSIGNGQVPAVAALAFLTLSEGLV